jgi:hypothetical protein
VRIDQRPLQAAEAARGIPVARICAPTVSVVFHLPGTDFTYMWHPTCRASAKRPSYACEETRATRSTSTDKLPGHVKPQTGFPGFHFSSENDEPVLPDPTARSRCTRRLIPVPLKRLASSPNQQRPEARSSGDQGGPARTSRAIDDVAPAPHVRLLYFEPGKRGITQNLRRSPAPRLLPEDISVILSYRYAA